MNVNCTLEASVESDAVAVIGEACIQKGAVAGEAALWISEFFPFFRRSPLVTDV